MHGVSRKLKLFLKDDLIYLNTQFVSRETNGEGVSRILEATGADHVISGMFSILRKGGYVTMVGLPKTSLHIENAAHNIGMAYIRTAHNIT